MEILEIIFSSFLKQIALAYFADDDIFAGTTPIKQSLNYSPDIVADLINN
jgi:hypothetical protein